MDQRPPNSDASENPYAAASLHESEPSHFMRSLAAVIIGVIAGLFAAATGYILCWAVVSTFLPGSVSATSEPNRIATTVIVSVLVAVMSGFIVGIRVGWNLNRRFRRVREVTTQRLNMTAQAANLIADIRESNAPDNDRSQHST